MLIIPDSSDKNDKNENQGSLFRTDDLLIAVFSFAYKNFISLFDNSSASSVANDSNESVVNDNNDNGVSESLGSPK